MKRMLTIHHRSAMALPTKVKKVKMKTPHSSIFLRPKRSVRKPAQAVPITTPAVEQDPRMPMVPQDLAVAAQWYQVAAEQNDSEAQVLLAYCYEVGAGVPKDPRAVVTLMTRAANSGYAEAQVNLALYYSQGLNQTAKDQKESFRWAKLAADQGYAQAERFVGACYEYGIGVQENPAEAAIWYNKAAAQGLARDGNVFNRVREYSMP